MKRRILIHTLAGAEIVVKEEIECDVTEIKGAEGAEAAEAAYILMDKIFHFRELKNEYSYIVALDKDGYPVSILESPPGERDRVGVDLVGTAYYSRAVNADHILQAHNHPSGDPTPSAADVDCFVEFYNIFGAQLLDYMVCGSDAAPPFAQKYYFSFREEEYFDQLRNSRQFHNIYIHHLEKTTTSSRDVYDLLDIYDPWSDDIFDLQVDVDDLLDEKNKLWEEIEKMKNSIKALEIAANGG